MDFVAPPGTTLVRSLGAGGTFRVAKVARAGAVGIARRPRGTLEAVEALARHDAVLRRVAGLPGVPERWGAGDDDHGPWTTEAQAAGVSLTELAAARALRPSMVTTIAAAAFSRLAALHAAADEGGPLEFVHGDLCPDHVFVAPDPADGVTFVDFGLARLRGVSPLHDARGTMPYVAPERARGETDQGPGVDVYALGACFLFALRGEAPGSAGAAALVAQGERGLSLEGLGTDPLGAALRRALAIDPDARGSAAELAMALAAAGPSRG